MRGFLIYDFKGYLRNCWFADRLIKIAKELKLDLTLKIVDDINDLKGELPDYAIVRTINSELREYLEHNNVRTFNNYLTSKVGNDKYETYLLCNKLNIPVMETKLYDGKNYEFPFIIKSVDGHGGSEVFLIENEQYLQNVLKILENKKIIIQKVASSLGVDTRVYVLGGKIICSIQRKAKNDFRSNFSISGEASLIDSVSENQLEIINKLYNELNFDLVGIDFIENNGEVILNEIEDVVGTRMIYRTTNIDIVRIYLEYILKKINK